MSITGYEQIMNDVDRKINNKVGTLVKAKKELNDDVQATTQSIKQEMFQLDKLGRKSVIDEIAKAKNDIIDHVNDFHLAFRIDFFPIITRLMVIWVSASKEK